MSWNDPGSAESAAASALTTEATDSGEFRNILGPMKMAKLVDRPDQLMKRWSFRSSITAYLFTKRMNLSNRMTKLNSTRGRESGATRGQIARQTPILEDM